MLADQWPEIFLGSSFLSRYQYNFFSFKSPDLTWDKLAYEGYITQSISGQSIYVGEAYE